MHYVFKSVTETLLTTVSEYTEDKNGVTENVMYEKVYYSSYSTDSHDFHHSFHLYEFASGIHTGYTG
jgi:hypothetical protein